MGGYWRNLTGEGCAPPPPPPPLQPPPPPNSSKFCQFHALFEKICHNHVLVLRPPRKVGAPTSGKSWIRNLMGSWEGTCHGLTESCENSRCRQLHLRAVKFSWNSMKLKKFGPVWEGLGPDLRHVYSPIPKSATTQWQSLCTSMWIKKTRLPCWQEVIRCQTHQKDWCSLKY